MSRLFVYDTMLTFPPDISFVIQIISFLVLWVGLKRLLFDPVLHVLEERESRTRGAASEAAAMRASAETAAAEYDRRLHEARQAASAEAQGERASTHAEEQQILTAAREQAGTQLTQLRESLSRQADAARPVLAVEARDLATRMVERVIGRPLA